MKKLLLILLPLFMLVNQACSQVATQAKVAEEKTLSHAPTEEENALLWKISGNGLEKASYLYGTIHMIDSKDYFLTDHAKSSFDKSERITFEINMEEMNNPFALLPLIQKVMMPDGLTLKDLLSEEDYQLVRGKLSESGMPSFALGMLEKVKPLFLSALGTGDMAPGDLQNGKMKSYEMEFMKMAQETKKEMAGLETIEYQMSIFDSIPYPEQAQMLVEGMRTDSTGVDQFREMVEIYKKEDIVAMQTAFGEEEGGLGGYDDVLLYQRNRNWIPIMGNMMQEKVTFFAVGAGHLGGEIGVISLLRKKGYKVEPIKSMP